jgi:hypothetical protein
LADLGEMPVACGNTFPGPVAARLSPKGRMTLAACPRCGHVANTSFDAKLAVFDASFEAALFHSPTYTAYATGVADRLVKEFSPLSVLEVASGSHVLTSHFESLGVSALGVPEPSVRSGSYDLVLARFVLEHMADPFKLLTSLRRVAKRAFFEVPDAGYDLTTAGWDCIYPHVGYFSAASLNAVAARAGWRLVETGTAFSDQYLWAIAERAEPSTVDPVPVVYNPSFDAATAHWQSSLVGKKAIVWGAGTRGTMFCNRVDPRAQLIAGVVDRNPGKHGRYLPITGHRVVSPSEVADLNPDTVILTNPSYATEIARELASLGVTASVTVA